jgi:anti-anti-sigma factor
MEMVTSETDGVHILACSGSLDTGTSAAAQNSLADLVDGGARKVVLDFGALEYISSAGLRVLLKTARRLTAAGGELRLCSLNESVQEVFDISGFGGILKITPDRDAALASF